MTESRDCAKADLHKSIVAKYIRKIVENEERTYSLEGQVCNVRRRFIDLLKITSKDVDSSCSYELVTSPVYASYLTSWGYEDNRRMGYPDNGKDLFELQCIEEKQNASIQAQQKRIIEMRNCFQILLHNMANDKENTRFLTHYLLAMDAPDIPPQDKASTKSLTDTELQILRSENEQLRISLQRISEPQMLEIGHRYTTVYGAKTVYLQSRKNVVYIQRDHSFKSNTSASPSGKSTSSDSASSISSIVFRTRDHTKDQQGATEMRLLDTAEWTQTFQSCQQRQSTTEIQMEEQTQQKTIYDQTVNEEISTCTMAVEFQQQYMEDVKENRTKQRPVVKSSRTSGSGESRSYPDGNSCSESLCVPEPCPVTPSLLGLLFTGFCELHSRVVKTGDVDITQVPCVFLSILKRIRTMCRSNYRELCEELDVPQGDLIKCSSEQDELQALNDVIQTWLRGQFNHNDRDTFPHMKMNKILNKFREI